MDAATALVEVRNTGRTGRGLFTTRAAASGQVLVQEAPLCIPPRIPRIPSIPHGQGAWPTGTWALTHEVIESGLMGEVLGWGATPMPWSAMRWDSTDEAARQRLVDAYARHKNEVFRLHATLCSVNIITGGRHALYRLGSFVNHACDPSADQLVVDGDAFVLVARRDLAPNTEVTVSYVPSVSVHPDMEAEMVDLRRSALLDLFGFTCACDACAPRACEE